MVKRVDSRRLRTKTQRPNKRRAMAKRQLELIPRNEKKERPAKKAASKPAIVRATPKTAAKRAAPKAAAAKPAPASKPIVRLTATDLAARQREISVSEFFTKNRHLLGFDSPAKALLTTVKEAVDEYEIQIDTKRNQPVIVSERELDGNQPEPDKEKRAVQRAFDHGTRVELEIEATYKKGRHSVDGYIEQTAMANPHASVTYVAPDGERHEYARVAQELPKAPLEIKPHPHGVELGILLKMLHETKARNIVSFLHGEFSRVSAPVAEEIAKAAGLAVSMSPQKAAREQAESLYKAIQAAKLMAPQSNVLSPIGEELLLEGLKKQITADFYAATSRSPAVYRGNPFLVEAALAYGGGSLPGDELITMIRFANRVPLLYQQSACAITKSVIQTTWKTYGIQQSRGALPAAPMVVMVHIASVWVPFTSESKEAVASYPEIMKEIKLAIQD